MNSSIRNTGWSSTKAPGSNPARSWRNTIARLDRCAARLAEVEIDHRDFERVLRIYDSPTTCFYLDPPYLPETRKKRYCYHQEMSLADHERLLACVQDLEGMVILSGYAHPLYQEALTNWDCLHLDMRCSSAVRPLNGQALPVEDGEWTRTECLWRNPACLQKHLTLFDGLEESGVRA